MILQPMKLTCMTGMHDVITRKQKQSVSKKVLALKRRSRGSSTSSTSNMPSRLPVADSYCDPSCRSNAEWMIADVWQQKTVTAETTVSSI